MLPIKSVKRAVAVVAFLWSLPALVLADQLAVVSGVSFDGQVISWNALDEATGYNIYRDSNYIATVRGSTSYTPETDGLYALTGFDDQGNFSPLQNAGESPDPLTNTVTVVIDAVISIDHTG